MEDTEIPFQLSTTLFGHKKDVRCLAAFESGGLVSGSRDLTARIWQLDESGREYKESLMMKTHRNFVSCICILPPDADYSKGLILTGSNDCSIHAFDIGNIEPEFKLEEHTDNVSVLAAGKFGTFVSGSWDCTAKVWMKQKCMMTLTGHQAAIWCVGILDSVGYIVTGSADKSIRVWKGALLEGTITGHSDCVRSIQVMPDNTFMSASNDATIRHWNLQGECLSNFQAHQSYIYTLSFLGGQFGELVSGGEDSSVRVWRGGRCLQTIPLPAQSVWSVCVINNGDIAVATSDGNIRIFTRSGQRVAPTEELNAYKELVSQNSIPAEVGDIKTEDLPGPTALLTPGRTEGQVMMVRGKSAIEAYQWSSHSSEWVKVGEVTGGVSEKEGSNKKKKIYKGKEYDYVFDVDIKENEPCLKLPYNLSQDPYTAAHNFLDDNNISQNYLDKVADFIMSQVPRTNQHRPPSSNLVDPYTGTARYHSDDTVNEVKSTSEGKLYQHFPEEQPLKFEVVNVAKLIEKMRQFNEQVDEANALFEEQLLVLQKLLQGGRHDNLDDVFNIFFKALSWSSAYLLPVLDSFRVCLLDSHFNKSLFSDAYAGRFDFLAYATTIVSANEKDPKNVLVLLRCLTNASFHKAGSEFLVSSHQRLLERLFPLLPADKNTQIALTSFILNLSIALTKPPPNTTTTSNSDKSPCINFIANALPLLTDHEAFFRLIVALGTLLTGDFLATTMAVSVDMASKVSSHQCSQSSSLLKVHTSATDVLKLMHAS